MLAHPLISILIPVFNREDFIEETLNSVIAQTYKNWECIIVDDGSTDNTISILENIKIKDARIKVYNRPNTLPKGANSCRNYAFNVCGGDYVNWFDSDDIMHPEFIDTKLKAFNIDCNCVISKTQFFSETINSISGKENRTFKSDNLLEDFITLKRSWYICDPMWKKSFLNEKELFSLKLLKGQDRDFHTRMLQNSKIKIKFIDFYLTSYRQHDKTISNTFSKAVAVSINDNLKERIESLKSFGISNKALLFMYIQLFKNYRSLQSQELKTLFFVLKKPILHIDYYKWIIKFLLASISYKLIGKGDILLR